MLAKVSVIAATALAAIPAANPGVTILAHRATQLLHSRPVYRNAVLLEAEGSSARPGRPVMTADKIVTWRFVFDNTKSKNKYKSVSIAAIRNELGVPRGSVTPFSGDQPMNPIPTLTFTQAVQLLNAAGWTKGFIAVTLRKPQYPGVTDPSYIFLCAGGKIVGVNTRTHEVKQIH